MRLDAIKNDDITYLEQMLWDEDNFKILSYQEFKDIPQNHIALFGHKYGLYTIPTLELIEFLEKQIGNKKDKTIEIAAGAGIISKALGITATDSYMQAREDVKALYDMTKQPVVQYGSHVLRYDALEAVRTFKPKIVVSSFGTHKWNPNEPWREGNEVGIDEGKILQKVKKYIHIGNEYIHRAKPILAKNHLTIEPEWLVTRAINGSKNVIWIWEG